jgi:hypothetical protein
MPPFFLPTKYISRAVPDICNPLRLLNATVRQGATVGTTTEQVAVAHSARTSALKLDRRSSTLL